MTTRRRIRNLFARPAARTSRKAPHRTRLTLEPLEARQLLATFTVTSAADDGSSGTLRSVIAEVNAASTPSTIDFDLGTSPATITLTQGQLELDNYFDGITIDGPGASMLTINGNDASRVFVVGYGTNASISGLTITGGSTTGQQTYGAGLISYVGTTTLTDCTISGNSSSSSGGGVANENGSMTITDCTITGNSSGTVGGGMLNFGSATITGSTFSRNTSADFGGGIENFSSATITGSTFSGNSAGYAGGGVDFGNNTTTTITGCIVSGNTAGDDGGGLDDGGNATITDSTFSGNLVGSAGLGGGLYIRGESTTVADCTISGNSGGNGGGVYVYYNTAPNLNDCTISGNASPNGGGLNAGGPATLTNTIVAGNTDGGGAASDIVGTVAGSSSHNLIGIGGSGGLSNGGSGSNIILTSLTNLGLAPLAYYGGPMETIALLPGSPAIGTGTSGNGLPTTDERGFALDSPSPDIGAFQKQTTSVPLVVNWAGDGPGQPGQLDLRVAVDLADIAGTSQTITFDPTAFATPQTIVLTQGPIVLNNTLAPVTVQAPAAGLTVSGGDQGTVFVVNGGATASISGLTITGGSAKSGGGLYNSKGATLTLTDCTITGNSASQGAGLENLGTVMLVDSAITGNSATGSGGGIFSSGTATLTGDTITGNSAQDGGGAYSSGKLTLGESSITGNSASKGGGASSVGSGTITDSTISGNSAGSGGGLYAGGTASLAITNCTISGNSAGSGGGLYDKFASPGGATISDGTISGNTATTGGGLDIASGSTSLVNTIVAGNLHGGTASDIAGTAAVSSSHNLIGTGGSGGLTGTNGNQVNVANPGLATLGHYGGPLETMALLPGSPALGTGVAVTGVTTDARGLPRPAGAGVDIGAFQDEVSLSPPTAITVQAGIATAIGLGSFNDGAGAGPYSVTVQWGDNSSPTTFSLPSTGSLGSQSHTYTNPGSDSITVTVTDANGDENRFQVTATVTPASTTATLSDSVTSISYGQPVTFTETVVSAGGGTLVPTGSVQFQIDGTPDGSPVPLGSTGAASITTSTLGVGSHTITATYINSDGHFAPPSTSQSVGVSVAQVATTTSVSESPSAPAYGQAVTFTATVSPASSGGGTPGGTVTFYDAGQAIDTATLVNGTATYIASNLVVGLHSITASYGGSIIFGTSSATPLAFTYARATPTVTVTDAGGTYNNNPFPATDSVAGVSGAPGSSLEAVPLTLAYYAGTTATGTPLAGAPTAAGTYTVQASFAGSTDYAAAVLATTFVIAQAAPTLTVADAGGTYSDVPFPATDTVAGVVPGVDDLPAMSLEGVSPTLTYYTGSTATGTPLAGAPTAAGTYTVQAGFAGSTDYAAAGMTATFVIAQVAPTIQLNFVSAYGPGSTIGAGATLTGVTGGPAASLEGVPLVLTYYDSQGNDLGTTAPTAPGNYSVVGSFAGTTDYLAVSTPATPFSVVTQTVPTITLTDAGGPNTGSPYPATATISPNDGGDGTSLEGMGLTLAYYPGTTATGTPLSGAPSDPGTYTVAASFPGSADYAAVTTSLSFTITSGVLQAGGLEFQTTDGSAFDVSGGVYTTGAGVQFGFVPASGQSFTPLAELDGNVTINTSALTVAGTGTLSAVISGTPIPLMSAGLGTTSITTLVNEGLSALSGSEISVAGTTFTLDSIQLNPVGPELQLQGSIALPIGLTVSVNGNNSVDISPSGVSLTGVTAALNGSFTLAGDTFNASQLQVAYTTASQTFAITGETSVTAGGLGTVSLDLGGGSTQGVVITDGVLTRLDATGSFDATLGGGILTATGVDVVYQPAAGLTPDQLAISGAADLSFGSNFDLSLTLGSSSSPGLLIQGGALASLDATASLDTTLAGATFSATGVSVTYVAASDSFSVSGSASLDFANGPDLSLTLGSAAQPGLVFSDGTLTSLDATASFSMTLAGATLSATGVNVTYVTATDDLEISGSASLAFGSTDLSLTLGSAAQPGLAFSGGALTSLDATASLNATIGGVKFSASALNLTYTAASSNTPDEFTVTGVASLSASFRGTVESITVDFGGGSTTGLVVSGGTIESLNMTVTSSFVAGGVTFGTNGLIATYVASATSPEVTFTGDAHFTVAGVGTVDVDFGGPGTQGLVITNGALSSLNMTVTSSLNIGGVSFTTSGLTITENVSARVFTVTGDASLTAGKLANVQVEFGSPASNGNAGSTGLVITGGTLTSLDMTVSSTITEAGVTLTADGLHLVYNATASPTTFSLSGTTTASFPGLGSFSVILGTAAHPSGLLIQGSNLVSLGMTINAALSIDKVTFNANKLAFDYTASSNLYQISGTTGVAIAGLGTLQVTFGTASHPDGVVISNGSLASLGVVVNGSFTVDKVGFTATNLELDYTASPQTFQIIGTAGATIGNIGSLSVTFANQGVVITNGSLVSLDAAVSGGFSVDKVGFTATNLELAYTASPQTIQITGTAGATIGGIGSLSVTFANQGVVITNGSLVSLDASITGGFKVAGLSFSSPAASPLQLNYVAATSTAAASFDVTGSATVAVTYFDASITVSFPGTGLVIKNGALASLDAAVSGGFKVAGLSFSSPAASPLQLNYVAATSTAAASFDVTGSATVAVTYFDASITVSFPGTGLVIKNGALASLDAAVSGGFKVAGLSFSSPAANPLQLNYVAATPTAAASFDVTGSATVAVTYFGASITVSFPGTGLVIKNGALVSLDAAVSGGFKVAGLSFSSPAASPLQLNYVAATSTAAASFDVTGSATVAVTYFGASITVSFPGTGLVIKNGALVSLDAAVSGGFKVAGLSFSSPAANPLQLNYVAATPTAAASFDVTGSATVAVTYFDASITVSFPGTGLVIKNGALVSLDAAVSGGFSVGKVSFSSPAASPLQLNYVAATPTAKASFDITGSASTTIKNFATLDLSFPNTGVVIAAGALVSIDVSVTSNFSVDGVAFTTDNLQFGYTVSKKLFFLSGSAGVTVGGIDGLTVNFGTTNPAITEPNAAYGILIDNGSLANLAMYISADFKMGALEIYTNLLGFDYTPAMPATSTTKATPATFQITGAAGINIGGITSQNNGVNAPGTNSLSITFGTNLDPYGILIQNGTLMDFDAEINANFWIDDLVEIKATDLEFAYETDYSYNGKVQSAFLMAGSVSAVLPYNIGNVTVTFGSQTTVPLGITTNTDWGLVIVGNQVATFDATISAGITLPVIGLGLGDVSVTFAYTAANNEYTLTGTGSLTLDGIITIDVALGTPATATAAATPGLVIEKGTLQSVDITATGALNLAPLVAANVSLTAAYTASTTTLAFGGTATVSLSTTNLPSWAKSFFGLGSNLSFGAGVGFYVSIDTQSINSSQSYAKFWVTESNGDNIGLEVDFTGKVSISLGTGSTVNTIMSYLSADPFDRSASILAEVEEEAEGTVGQYTTNISALLAAYAKLFGGVHLP